jgi:hypothetical protein
VFPYSAHNESLCYRIERQFHWVKKKPQRCTIRDDGQNRTFRYLAEIGQEYVFHAVVKTPSSSISMIAPVHQMMDGIGRNGLGSSSAWTVASIMKSITQKPSENSTHVNHDL